MHGCFILPHIALFLHKNKITPKRQNIMIKIMNNSSKLLYSISSYKCKLLRYSTKSKANGNAISYCADIVRRHDYENFLATLLMTTSIRSPSLVIRAFNVEIAKIQDQTSDPQTAAFRLQFWQDLLKKIQIKDQQLKNIPSNPIAQELFKVCSCYKIPIRYLEKLVTSRSRLLKSKHFQSLEDVEKYSEDTVSSIYYLILSIAGITSVHADHAASHLGKAQGITNILRSVHIASQLKMISIPMDILMKHGVSQQDVLRGVDNENLRQVVFEVASRANSHLQKARSIVVPKMTRQILLPATAVDVYLSKLQQCNFNVFQKSLQKSSATLPFNLYVKRLLNKY